MLVGELPLLPDTGERNRISFRYCRQGKPCAPRGDTQHLRLGQEGVPNASIAHARVFYDTSGLRKNEFSPDRAFWASASPQPRHRRHASVDPVGRQVGRVCKRRRSPRRVLEPPLWLMGSEYARLWAWDFAERAGSGLSASSPSVCWWVGGLPKVGEPAQARHPRASPHSWLRTTHLVLPGVETRRTPPRPHGVALFSKRHWGRMKTIPKPTFSVCWLVSMEIRPKSSGSLLIR